MTRGMRLSRPSRWVALLLALIALEMAGPLARAADPPTEKTPLRFQRWYAPTNRVADWPREPGVKYRPVDTDEFERLLEAARANGQGDARLVAARIDRSVCRARLTADDLLTGEVVLGVEHPGSGPSLLDLDPWRQAVTHARWEAGGELEHRESTLAVLGTSASGRAAVVVEHAGELRIEWSLRGRLTGASMAFDLGFPPSPVTTLELDLPVSRGLRASAGRLTLLETDPANTGFRTWRLQLGGHSRVTLRVEPDAGDNAPRLPLIRQSSIYEISPHGAELAVTLELDANGPPVERLELDLDPDINLVSAGIGAASAQFMVSVDPDTRRGRAIVHLPKAPHASSLTVQLSALAPVAADRPWPLPRVRPQNAFWQDGKTTLLIESTLRLDRLMLTGCRQSMAGRVAPPKAAELVELQCFDPDAHAELLLATRADQPRMHGGSTVILGAGELASLSRTEFELADGERFNLRAKVLPQWTIDSVVSDPPAALADWDVRTDDSAERVLHCRLAQPLSASHPVTLEVAARKLRSPLGEVLTVDELQVLEFKDLADSTRMMRIRALGPYQVRLTGDERLTRIDPAGLPPRQAALFDKQPGGLCFLVDAGADGLGVSLDPQSPRFQAEIEVEATTTGSVLCESYLMRCVPEASPLERVTVRLTQARRGDLEWTLADGEMAVDARRLSVAPPRDDDAAEGETWEVLLPSGLTSPFELRARRCTPLVGLTGISLASLPAATRQSGTLSIYSRDAAAPRIENRGLTSLPAPGLDEPRDAALRGRFRFDPQRQDDPAGETALRIMPRPGDDAQADLVIWECRVVTRLEPSGALHHAVLLRAENLGASRLKIGLPADARVDLVVVDDVPVAPRYDASHGLLVDLPTDRPRSAIGLRFSTPQPPGNWARGMWPRELAMPQLRIEAPVLTRQWTLWLPPGFGPWSPIDSDGNTTIGWRQRLFGVFARRPGEPPFNPLSPADWTSWSGDPPQRAAARQAVGELLAWLGTDSPEVDLDWHGRLLRAADALEQDGTLLLIDRAELAAAGVRPKALLRPGAGESPNDRGIATIERAGLAVLARERVVLVTSAARAARLGPALEPWHGPCIGWVNRGPLASQLLDAALDFGSAPFVRVDAWREPLSDHAPLAPPATFDPIDTLGWSAWQPAVHGHTASLEVIPTALPVVLGWGAFLLVFLACWRAAENGPRLSCLVCGSFAALALTVPAAWAPLASGAFLGSLAGLALALMRPRSAPSALERRSAVRSSRSQTQPASILLLALAALLVGPARGQDATPARERAAGRVHRVIVPVDDPDKPERPLYYLAPEEFLTELQRRAALATRQPRGWLIERATYRAQLVWDFANRRLSAGELRVGFDLQVFGGAPRLTIPLPSAGLDPRPEVALLDGVEVPILWDDDGLSFSVPAPGPGPCRLELTMRPPSRLSDSGGAVRLSIPPTPRATLELMLPADAPPVQISSALADVVAVEGGRRLLAVLGPTDELRFEWRDQPTGQASPSTFEVDELLWLHVQPGSVVLDAAFKLAVRDGSVRSLRLRVDPRLRALPLDMPDPTVVETRVDPADPSVIELLLSRPASETAVARARFLIVGATGFGRLALPRLDVLDATTVRRMLGVSVAPTIEMAGIDRGPEVEEMAVPDFAERWAGQDEPPRLAWRLGGAAPAWSLATVPRTETTNATAALTLSLGPRRAEFRFVADVQAPASSVFQRRLSVPAEARIDRVEIREQGNEVASRWVRDSATSLVVRLSEPASASQQWIVHGWLPSSESAHLGLPRIGIDGVTCATTKIQILRQPEVTVQASDVTGLASLDAPAADVHAALPGRRALGFTASGPDFAANLLLSPNKPRVDATQITVLRRQEQGGWTAEARLRLKIADGLLDELRVRVPRDWNGPFQVEPAAHVETIDLPGEPWRQLLVRPRDAMTGDAEVTIQAPLDAVDGMPVAAPDLLPQGLAVSERILVLPTQVGLRQITWDTRGLRPREMPAELATARISTALFEAYQVGDGPFAANLRLSRPVTGSPVVKLADVHVVWQADRSCQGVAAFDIAAADETSCPLWMPEDYKLVEVFVDGWNITPVNEAAGRWRVPLEPDRLPQRLEVLFEGRMRGGQAGTMRCEAPRIADWEVEQSLWSVRGPDALGTGVPSAAEALGPLRPEVFRLRAAVDQIADVAADERRASAWTREDQALWFASRADRVARLLARCDDLAREGRNPEVVTVATADMRSVEQQAVEAARRMGLEGIWQAALRKKEFSADRSALLPVEGGSAAPPARCAFHGPMHALAVRYPAAPVSDAPARWLLAGLVLSATVAAAWGLRRIRTDRAARWLPVVAIIAGLAWWWWLSPSVLGLLLAIVSAAWWGLRHRGPQRVPVGSSIVELEALQR
jgi:hypothetical protein